MARGRGWLSDQDLMTWVRQATLDNRQRAVGFEAMKALRDGGGLTEVNIEETLRKLVEDQDVLFTKYTAQYMLRNIPEGIPRY